MEVSSRQVAKSGRGMVVAKNLVKQAANPVFVPNHLIADGHCSKVNVIKDGDDIKAIEIICECGKTLRLRCIY